jgi:S-adenosylmethionine:tRNA ribosyltransferase-isomerase
MTIEFTLPQRLAAREPPEARGERRDGVRMLVSRRRTEAIAHHAFTDLASVLLPGDLVVVNTSGTLPAAVRASRASPAAAGLSVHFSTPLPDGTWLAELRAPANGATAPFGGGTPGMVIDLPGGARLTLAARVTGRLWRARLSTAVIPYLLRHGTPIRYSYVAHDWPIDAYQTVFATRPGSAEMPSAGRPFTAELVTRLVARGVTVAPITLDTGVSSLEGGEPPYPEPYDVPPSTARLVNLTRRSGGRVIAAGTTVVRALETAARDGFDRGRDPGGNGAAGGEGPVVASAGWTDLIVSPRRALRAVDGLLTGLHEPRSSHLLMLEAFAGPELLRRCYAAALERGYLWHEFGDVHLLLP